MKSWTFKFLLPLTALSAAQAQTAAAQDEPVLLEAVSAWELDYAEDSCALRRSFGAADSTTWLEIRSYSPLEEVHEITVASNGFALKRQAPLSYFVPDGQPVRYDAQTYGEYRGLPAVTFYNKVWLRDIEAGPVVRFDPDMVFSSSAVADVDRFRRNVSGFRLDGAFDVPLVLGTGEMRRPLGALRLCLLDLMASWGIDPDNPTGVTRRLQNLPGMQWVEGLRARQPQTIVSREVPRNVSFRLIVGSDGHVERCDVTRPKVDKEYENWACGLIRRTARFDPALDAQGEPVRVVHEAAVLVTGGQDIRRWSRGS
jgi:hypothetical protein